MTVKTALVRVGGHQVRMRLVGDGEPLLLLNGLSRPLESWEPFTRALHGRTVISFDAPGVGGSPTPILPMSISMLAALTASLLDQVGLDRADVLGFSHGGAVAQQLAVQAPGKIRRLVLVSTSCGIGATPGVPGSLRARPARADPESWPRPHTLGILWHSLAISSWSSIPFLAAIRMPTLVVSGAHDRVVPPENSTLLARRIPGAELVLVSAGHDLQRRGPAATLASVVEPFLAAGSDLAPLTVGS